MKPTASVSVGELAVRATDAIPGGTSTGSKRPDALYGAHAHDSDMPTHFERAEGCTIIAPDGRSFIDCTMALGAVAIGYADAAVTKAVQSAAAGGNVSGLPHRLEVVVAERIIEAIPCAEQVRFLRTGAEANAAAVRLARASTARTHIIASGYFGWLDWCSSSRGVPATVQNDVSWIPFGDVNALEQAVLEHGTDVAAIILEPLVHDIAPVEWLAAARAACDRIGAVLIFDEIKTAFRIRTGGVQELHRIIPDLTTLGKALANGYPLAAVVGRAAIMELAQSCWISSTAAAESTGLAAALAVLEWHDRVDVSERLLIAGNNMKEAIGEALDDAPWAGIRVDGPPQMFRIVAAHDQQLDDLVAAGVRHGVLLKRGAYQFASLAHDDRIMFALRQAMNAACMDMPRTRGPQLT